MSNRWLVAGLIVSVVVNLVSVFALGTYWRKAAPHPKSRPSTADTRSALDRLKPRFGLTATQMDTLRALHEFRHRNLRPLRNLVDARQREILGQLQHPDFNAALVDSLMRDMLAARDSLETGALAVMLRLRNVLTPEQRVRLPELYAELQQAGQFPGRDERPPPGAKQPDGRPPRHPGRR